MIVSRFPCCVLLALSLNTNENPSTDKLSRAINYFLRGIQKKSEQKHRQEKARKLMLFEEQTDGERNSNAELWTQKYFPTQLQQDRVRTMFLKEFFCYQP